MAISAIATWWVRMPKNAEPCDEPWRAEPLGAESWGAESWGAMMLTAIEPIGGVKRYADRRGDHRVFQDQIVEPVALERRIGAFHGIVSLAPSAPTAPLATSCLTMVVLASHSPARSTVLRLVAVKPRFSKKPLAV